MPCKKCEALITDLIRLMKGYRYSYFVNGAKDCLEVIEAGSIEPIRKRDKRILKKVESSAKARAEVRRRKI